MALLGCRDFARYPVGHRPDLIRTGLREARSDIIDSECRCSLMQQLGEFISNFLGGPALLQAKIDGVELAADAISVNAAEAVKLAGDLLTNR